MLASIQAWTSRYEMNADGIQYLDNADAYRSGDFRNAVSPQWSPLYPWLIGALFDATRPAREQQFPLVHFLNFLLFTGSVAAFLFFARTVYSLIRPCSTARLSFLLISCSAFLYCSLDLTSLRYVAPDLLVNLFAFLAAGFLIRIATGSTRIRDYVSFGLLLGLGYLAKTPFLFFGLLCLSLAFIVRRSLRLALTAAIWIAIVVPYIAILSYSEHRLTAGDSGKYNVIWHVNGVPNTNWQGGPERVGWPLHPTRQLSAHPAIFEFASPIAGTYAPWYNPVYWNEGAKISFRPTDFARAVVEQIRLYGFLAYHRQLPLLFALLAVFLLTSSKREIVRGHPVWPILAFGATPFLMYAPIHAEGRYLAPFFVFLWVSLSFGLIQTIDGSSSRALLAIASTASLLMTSEAAIVALPSSAIGERRPPERLHYEIARDLRAFGQRDGDRVARVAGDLPYYWARLAGARITVDISFSENFRNRPAEWASATKILSSDLAAFVVSPDLPGVVDQPGWIELGSTRVFVYPIRALRTSK